jgi:hypothetical protein
MVEANTGAGRFGCKTPVATAILSISQLLTQVFAARQFRKLRFRPDDPARDARDPAANTVELMVWGQDDPPDDQ